MKLAKFYAIGALGALVLSMSAVATADTTYTTPQTVTGTATFDSTYTFTGQGAGTPQLTVDSGANVTIDGATFENDGNGTNINSEGTTTITSATFANDQHHILTVSSGVTSIYGATLTGSTALDFNVNGTGEIDLYGDFGTLNGTTWDKDTDLGTFTGVLQNDDPSTQDYTFTDNITGKNAIIKFIEAPVTSTPEPSPLTTFAIAAIALVGFAGLRRRVRA